MLFAIDVGNTNIVMGFFENDKLISSYRMATDKSRSSDEIGLFFMQILNYQKIKITEISDVIISSVVPTIMHSLENAVKKYIKKTPIIADNSCPLGINILIDHPRELGSDRIVNAFAACELYNGPIIVIDFGTATTFCVIDADKNYLGGVIYPGIKISADALVEKTSKLPRVEIIRPDNVIGKNTVSCMQSGLVFGYAGMIDSIIDRIKMEYPNAKVVATGGLAGLIAKETKGIDIINKTLTLDGLNLIYKKVLNA